MWIVQQDIIVSIIGIIVTIVIYFSNCKNTTWIGERTFTSDTYRILCSVLLGTSDNVIWPVLSFQVDAHWGEVKGIKSYLQCIEGAKIWPKQLSPSWIGYPPESSEQHSVGCSGSVCIFVCLCVFMFMCVCVYLNMCALVYVCVRWLMHLKVWQKQLSPSCQHNPHEAS